MSSGGSSSDSAEMQSPGRAGSAASPQWTTVQAEREEHDESGSGAGNSGKTASPAPAKSKRGRPRLDTKDENAADRRRTQIRLAQRAYRQRKETTITRLEYSVNVLQESLDKLNGLFTEYCKSAKDAPEAYLDDLAQRFAVTYSAAKSITSKNPAVPEGIQEEEEERTMESTEESPTSGRRYQQEGDAGAKVAPMQLPALAGAAQAAFHSPPAEGSEGAPKRRRTSDPMSIDHINYVSVPILPPMPHLLFGRPVPDSLPHKKPTPESVLYKTPKPVYSFDETNFGRRLHRAGYERAYHALSSPRQNNVWLQRAFALSASFDQPHKFSSALKKLLSAGTDSPLSATYMPLIPLGAAGRHFPSADPDRAHRQAAPSPALFNKVVTIASQLDPSLYGGLWLTPYEVNVWLKQRGYWLDGVSTIADVVPVEDIQFPTLAPLPTASSVPDLTRSPSLSGHSTSPSLASVPDTREQDLAMTTALTALLPAALNGSVVGKLPPADPKQMQINAMLNLPSFDSIPPIDLAQPTRVPQYQQRRASLEVDRFIQRLLDRGVCLGRTPGFRLDDVESALRECTTYYA